MQVFLPYLKLIAVQLLKKYKTKVFVMLTETQTYKWFLFNVVPYIRFNFYYTSMRGWKYHRGYTLLEPGDIILTTDNNKFSTKIIGGEFAHAGLCLSKDGKFECAEMTHKNFTKSTFSDMCYEADRVVIVRCKDWDKDYVQEKIIPKCLSFKDAKYDTSFSFSLGNEFLYCSEMVYEADVEKRLKVDLDDLILLGRQYLSPTGLYKAKNVEIIWDSNKEKE